jgi:hypothetical protein
LKWGQVHISKFVKHSIFKKTKKGVPVEELLFAFLSVYILSLRKQVAPLTGSVKVKIKKAKIICERALHYSD